MSSSGVEKSSTAAPSPSVKEKPENQEITTTTTTTLSEKTGEMPCVFCLQFSSNVENDTDGFLKSKLLKILVENQGSGEKGKFEEFRPVDPWKGMSVCSSCKNVTVTIKTLQDQVKALESRINKMAEDLLEKAKWSKTVHTIVPLNNKGGEPTAAVNQNKLILQGLKIKGPSTQKRVRKFHKGRSVERKNFFENWVLYRKYLAKLKCDSMVKAKDVLQVSFNAASSKVLPTLMPKLTMPVAPNFQTFYLTPASSTGSPAAIPYQAVPNPVPIIPTQVAVNPSVSTQAVSSSSVRTQVVSNSSIQPQIVSNYSIQPQIVSNTSIRPQQVISTPSAPNQFVSNPAIAIPAASAVHISTTVYVDARGRIISVVHNNPNNAPNSGNNVVGASATATHKAQHGEAITSATPSSTSSASLVKPAVVKKKSSRRTQANKTATEGIAAVRQKQGSSVQVPNPSQGNLMNPRVVISRLRESEIPSHCRNISAVVVTSPSRQPQAMSFLSLNSNNTSAVLPVSAEKRNQRKRPLTLRKYSSASSSDDNNDPSPTEISKSKRPQRKSRNRSTKIIVFNNIDEVNFVNNSDEDDVPQEDPLAGTNDPFSECNDNDELEEDEIIVKEEFEEFEISPEPDP